MSGLFTNRGDPRSIEALPPYVVLDRGSKAFSGRRRSLRLQLGTGLVVLLARTRALPAGADDGGSLIHRVADGHGG